MKEWDKKTLAEVCEIMPSKQEVKDLEPETEVSFIPMAAVSEEGKILSQETRRLKKVSKGYTYFRDYDILLAKITPCFENGKRALAEDLKNGVGFGTTEFHVLRPKESVIPKWIFYAISDERFRNLAKNKMTGTAGQKRVPKRVLERYEIPVPSIEEQSVTVEAIETQFARLDSAIKTLNSLKSKLSIYRKSVLSDAFEGKLTDISEWFEGEVGDLGEVITGTTPSKKKNEYYGADYCFFKPTDLNKGYYTEYSEDMLSNKGIKKARLLPRKSILVTCIGATIGKTGFNRTEGATNQQINAVIPDGTKFTPALIYFLFISETMQRQIKEKSSSTTLPILNKTKFQNLKIKIPKKKEEQRILQQTIEEKFSIADNLENSISIMLRKMESLRKSILKSAFEGKLVKEGV